MAKLNSMLKHFWNKPHYIVPGFNPDHFLADKEVNSINDINGLELKQMGIYGLIMDIDQTLTDGYDSLEISPKVASKYKELKEQFDICHLSNTSYERALKLYSVLGCSVIRNKEVKPSFSAFKQAMRYLSISPGRIVMIGDLRYIDIAAANKLGLYTIKVKPLDPKNEPLPIMAWRQLENIVEKIYRFKLDK